MIPPRMYQIQARASLIVYNADIHKECNVTQGASLSWHLNYAWIMLEALHSNVYSQLFTLISDVVFGVFESINSIHLVNG